MSFLFGKPSVEIISIGETNAVGERICLLVKYGQDAIVLDCGQKIPLDSPKETEEGSGLSPEYFPDFSYIAREKLNVLGVFVSHGHMDHIGALKKFVDLYPGLPIIGSRFTQGVVHEKLFTETQEGFVWDTRDKLSLGPFEARSFPVLHSVPGALGFLISVGKKNIFYTGDIKTPGDFLREGVDERAEKRLIQKYAKYHKALCDVGKLGVDALIGDVTNIHEAGYAQTEEHVYPKIDGIVWNNGGRIFISVISSNAERVRNIVKIAYAKGREVYAAGSSLRQFMLLAGINGWNVLNKHSVERLPKNAVILATGCQGEPGSFLDRLSRRELDFALEISGSDSLLISSDTIPIPEIEARFVMTIERLSAMFGRIFLTPDTPQVNSRGAVIKRVADLHVSGHGKQSDISCVLDWTEPRFFVPYHADFGRRSIAGEFAKKNHSVESALLTGNQPLEI